MNLIKKIKENDFIKGVLSIGSGNIIGQGISIITVPILSRIYSLEAYGEYGVITSFAIIITSFATLGLMSAIMAPKDGDESNSVFTAAFWTQLVLSSFLFIVFLLISPFHKLYNIDGSYYLSLVMSWLFVLFSNVKNVLYVSVNRKRMNKTLLWNPIIGGLGNIFVALPLGLLGFGYEGFMIAIILSESIMCIQMLLKYNPLQRNFSFKKYVDILKKYKDYILFQCPANVVQTYGTQYPVQFLSSKFDSNALGGFSMCEKLLKYPTTLIASPISMVYFRTAYTYSAKGHSIAELTYKMITKLMLVAFGPLVIIIFYGEPLFSFVLGSKWGVAGTMASILIYQYVLLFCAKCVSYCRVSIGRQKDNLLFYIINLVLIICTFLFSFFAFGSLIKVLIAYSIIKCLLQVIDMAFNFYCMKQYFFKYLLFIGVYSTIVITIYIFAFAI